MLRFLAIPVTLVVLLTAAATDAQERQSPVSPVAGAVPRPVDLDRYCLSRGLGRSINVDGTGYGWRCSANNGNVSVDLACQEQYGPNVTTRLVTPPPGRPGDWQCVVPPAVTCEGISQTEIAGGPPAWLAVAAPPYATTIKTHLYARYENSTNWVECKVGTVCTAVEFPDHIDYKSIAPEGYHFFYLRPAAYMSVTDKYAFSQLGQARLGVQYDIPGPTCLAMQIIEVGPRDWLETRFVVPAGHVVTGYRWYQKANILPPTPPPPPWIECKTDNSCWFPMLFTKPFSDGGGDHANGYQMICSNRTFGQVWTANTVTATACRIDVSYTP
jgi:hypothetical protein